MTDDSLKIRIIRGSSTILFFTFLVSPIAYLIRVLYSRTLTIDQYGLFYAVAGFFALLSAYNDLGFGYSVSLLVPKFLKKKNYLQCWNLYKYEQIIEVSSSIFISVIFILSARWLADSFFKVHAAENLIYIFSIYFITNSFLEAIRKFFQGLQQEVYYSSIQFLKLFFTLIFSAGFLFFGIEKITYYAICWSAANIIVVVIYNFLLYKNNKYIIKSLCWDKALFRLMYKFALPALITSSVYSLIVYSDIFFLTLFKGVREVGIYNIILPIASISALFLSPINKLLLPMTSHLMEGEKDKIQFLLKILFKIIPFVALYFGLFVSLFPSIIIVMLFGEKWKGLTEMPLIILALGYIFSVLTSALSTLINGAGLVKQLMYSSIIISVATIMLSIFLIPLYGILGAVIANTIVYVLSVFIYGRILNSVISFKYPLFYYMKLLFFSLTAHLLLRYLKFAPEGWIQFIITGLIYTIIFLLFGYFSKLYDKRIIRLLIKNYK